MAEQTKSTHSSPSHDERIRRLADACALLDPAEERALAEEGLAADAEALEPY
jgi:hypothetical protein